KGRTRRPPGGERSAEVDVTAQVVGLVHVRSLPDRVDDVLSGPSRCAHIDEDVFFFGVGAGFLHQFEVVPPQFLGRGVEALRRDVDLEVVGAVLGTVVQVDGEVLGHGSCLPGAHRVEGAVTATFGVTTAAKGAVRELPLVITVDVLPVETVPVPHGVRVVLPCLPAHGVDLFHVRVLVVIAPPVPATVVACGGDDHGTVRGGRRGERGQSEQGDGHKNECAGDPARDSGCGVLRLHCVLRCSQPGRLSNGSAPKRVDYPWK